MSKRILLVDDEDDARTIAQMALEMSTNWTILTASSGQEAIRLAESNRPDVILLDMMMPGMDGRTTLQQLKTNPQTASIPVILATAKVRPSERANLEKLDVIAVFTKPIRPLDLAEQILKALDNV